MIILCNFLFNSPTTGSTVMMQRCPRRHSVASNNRVRVVNCKLKSTRKLKFLRLIYSLSILQRRRRFTSLPGKQNYHDCHSPEEFIKFKEETFICLSAVSFALETRNFIKTSNLNKCLVRIILC